MATTPLKTCPKNLHSIFCQRVYNARPAILATFARISRYLTPRQRASLLKIGGYCMNSTIKQFCQSLTIPCGFTDAESEVYTNAAMTDILWMTLESSQVLNVFHEREEVMRNKRLPLSLLSTLPGGYKKPPQPLRFNFFSAFR